MPLNVLCETHNTSEPFNRDVCRILGFNNPKDALLTRVKKAYKIDVVGMELAGKTAAATDTYNEGLTRGREKLDKFFPACLPDIFYLIYLLYQ